MFIRVIFDFLMWIVGDPTSTSDVNVYTNTWFLTFLGTTWAEFERYFTLELDQCSKFKNSPKLSTNQDSYWSPCIVKLNQNKRKKEQELKLDRIKKLATEPKKKQRTKLENRM